MAIPNQRKARRPTIVVSNASLKTSISRVPLLSHGSGISSGNASTASFRPQTGLSASSHQSNSAPPPPIVSTRMPLIVVPLLSAEPQQCYSTPFRMNTYEKQGGWGCYAVNQIAGGEICPEEHRDEGPAYSSHATKRAWPACPGSVVGRPSGGGCRFRPSRKRALHPNAHP